MRQAIQGRLGFWGPRPRTPVAHRHKRETAAADLRGIGVIAFLFLLALAICCLQAGEPEEDLPGLPAETQYAEPDEVPYEEEWIDEPR